MNINQVINAAREAIAATGLEVKTISRGNNQLVLGVRNKSRHRVFGPASPLTCWTQAYEYATRRSWVLLLTDWRNTARPTPKKPTGSNRGEITVIAGHAIEVERQLNKLDANGHLLSVVYTRRGQRKIIAHAEVI